MTISLPPDIQKFVEEKVKAGDFPDETTVVVAAIAMMRTQSKQQTEEDLEWLRAQVKIGMDELDRGEFAEWDVEEIKADGRRLLAERKKS